MRLAFLFCVESGPLEPKAVLLARSIRRWGGAHADSRIHAYLPRPGASISPETGLAFAEMGVELDPEPANTEHPHDPMVSRIHAGALAERTLDDDVLVFCDTDSVFLREPRQLALRRGVDAGVRPVGIVGKGSTGPGHRNEAYWARMYELAGATGEPYVRTVVSRDRIRAYWNAGLIATRREAGIFGEWRDVLRTLLDADHLPDTPNYPSIDQLSLAATLARRPDRVKRLNPRYNYPLQKRRLLGPRLRALDLDQIVHVHYHRWFQLPGFLERVRPPLDPGTPQFRWLAEQLPLEPLIDEPLHGEPRRSKRPDGGGGLQRPNPYVGSR
jgi:hypothetical protein